MDVLILNRLLLLLLLLLLLYVNVFEDCISKASERGITPQREVQGGDTNRGLPVQSRYSDVCG